MWPPRCNGGVVRLSQSLWGRGFVVKRSEREAWGSSGKARAAGLHLGPTADGEVGLEVQGRRGTGVLRLELAGLALAARMGAWDGGWRQEAEGSLGYSGESIGEGLRVTNRWS